MWQLYWAKNTLKQIVPFQRDLRRLKRRFSHSPNQINERSVYAGGFDQISLLTNAGLNVCGLDVLEVGTGWFPVIPLMMRLAGARHVTLTDAHMLLDIDTLNTTVRFLLERKVDLAERLAITVAAIEDQLRVVSGGTLEDMLAGLGMTYAVPFDYKQSEARVDVIISHTVLEHISPRMIEELMRDWPDHRPASGAGWSCTASTIPTIAPTLTRGLAN